MSKIGKKIITIPENVVVNQNGGVLEISSKDGKNQLRLNILPYIGVKIDGNQMSFLPNEDSIQARSNWGTMRALTQNAIIGVSEGFKKILEFSGVGFRAAVEGKNLILNIGFSHPVKFAIPDGVSIVVDSKINNITISGIDKSLVGEAAAKIRAKKKTNPYRGTGIKYKNEIIKKKAGKKASGATGAA